jgi:hypothetical protein
MRQGLGGAPGWGGVRTPRRSLLGAGAALVTLLLHAAIFVPGASALEALDGRIQAHGFFEMQMRGISAGYSDQFDIAQWYNIFNIELELDLVRDTHGPLDLVSAFIRVEARFDCIYSRGCGIIPGIDIYGNRARNLPGRLSGATTRLATGNQYTDERYSTKREWDAEGTPINAPIPEVEGRTETYRNYSRDFDEVAADRQPQNLSEVSPFDVFAGSSGADSYTGIPHLDLQYNADQGDDPFPEVFASFTDFRFTTIQGHSGSRGGLPLDTLGPWLPENFVEPNAALSNIAHPLDPRSDAEFGAGYSSESVKKASYSTRVMGMIGYDRGDFDPNDTSTWYDTAITDWYNGGGTRQELRDEGLLAADAAFGRGAYPFRSFPLQQKSVATGDTANGPRGIFVPSMPLRQALDGGQISPYEFNRREIARAFNHGDSQAQTGELKEAYLDVEMFDSRLWMRLGKQSIVWGKTELFRTTDQFNPQDLALASLPSLEESRIALWSARAVWSFYDVGPFEDVRAEFAFNFDEFKPNDLGNCGEPYTPNLVCQLTFGSFGHGVAGTGVAGTQRPATLVDGGYELGGRVEWRWGRFSFALMDFYGFADLPYLDRISTFERNVDPVTGRPRFIAASDDCVSSLDGFAFDPGSPNAGIVENLAGCLTPGVSAFDPIDQTPNLAENIARVGVGDARNTIDWSPINQQSFAMICSTTIGFSNLDPVSCAQTIFGSDALVAGVLPINNFFGAMLAGNQVIAGIAWSQFGGTPANRFTFNTVPLNTDPYDSDASRVQPDCLAPNLGGSLLPCGTGGILGVTLTADQEALLGCGPLLGSDCDADGVDLMNGDASVLLQAFGGFEGTPLSEGDQLWTTFGMYTPDHPNCVAAGGIDVLNPIPDAGYADNDCFNVSFLQPGTAGFEGGPVGTYYDVLLEQGLTLPGARGPNKLYGIGDPITGDPAIDERYEYSPRRDGCVRQLQAGHKYRADCAAARTLYHPNFDSSNPRFSSRAQTQEFDNEMAVLSWNFMTTVVPLDERFDPDNPERLDQCSLTVPWKCSIVSSLFSVTGVTKDAERASGAHKSIERASGNYSLYGRRTFAWQSGGEVVTRYAKRNVLGFSTDFAEDRTKTNWSMEFTWIGGHPVTDNTAWSGVSSVDDFNLTISVDRPTFINFLNANRTFFFNSQFFASYRSGYNRGMTANGPYNFLLTFTASTGYYQDRLLPSFTAVVDFKSSSGALIASLAYRVSQDFSIQIGAAGFFGGIRYLEMPVNGAGPVGNHQGPNAYQVGVENGLSAVRDRDEVFLRLRYTF